MKKFLIIAGEPSGDLHGGALIRSLKKINPDLSFVGIGGDQMIAEGLEEIIHLKNISFLGFVEVIKHIPLIKRLEKKLLSVVEKENIDNIILIDYPGFNLRIAKKLKALNKKIFYYISPQIWAWKQKRVHKIKKFVDKMLVLFPFEKKFYSDFNVNVEYVGHPLIDRINEFDFCSKKELFNKFNLELNKEILLLLPGSRIQEVRKIFPEIIKAASKLAKDFNLQIVVACSNNINENEFSEFQKKFKFKIIKNYTYNLFKHSKFGIIKSGTSTLEAALIGIPFVLVYATNYLTYLLGKQLIKIKNIGLVNIVAEEQIIDELIQKNINDKNIYNTISNYLKSDTKLSELKSKLQIVKNKLGTGNASTNAAKIIMENLK